MVLNTQYLDQEIEAKKGGYHKWAFLKIFFLRKVVMRGCA